jgi:hypothetical protein
VIFRAGALTYCICACLARCQPMVYDSIIHSPPLQECHQLRAAGAESAKR